MKKYFAAIFVCLFLLTTPCAQAETLLRKFVRHEIKAEMQDIADSFVPKDIQKDIKKQYKEYKKEKERAEKEQKKEEKRAAKLRKKKQKRIAKEKERQGDEKFQAQVEKAQDLQEQENFEFQKYNEPQGSQELDFFGIYGKRQINSDGVVSPDFSRMIYSEVHFYPSLFQLSTELFLIPLPSAETPVERVMHSKTSDKKAIKFYRAGMDAVEPQFFKTMTVVDWSSDSKKILAKERIAENLRCFLETRVWVYDFDTQKTYYIENLRKNIENYWLKNDLDLTKYKWDLTPMGWYEPMGRPSRQILVNAYGYKPDKTKVFLGTWIADYETGDVEYVKRPSRYKASQNGMVLKPKPPKI